MRLLAGSRTERHSRIGEQLDGGTQPGVLFAESDGFGFPFGGGFIFPALIAEFKGGDFGFLPPVNYGFRSREARVKIVECLPFQLLAGGGFARNVVDERTDNTRTLVESGCQVFLIHPGLL